MVCVWFPTSLIINLINELNASRYGFVALMGLLYETLYQTVRICNGLNWSEVA